MAGALSIPLENSCAVEQSKARQEHAYNHSRQTLTIRAPRFCHLLDTKTPTLQSTKARFRVVCLEALGISATLHEAGLTCSVDH